MGSRAPRGLWLALSLLAPSSAWAWPLEALPSVSLPPGTCDVRLAEPPQRQIVAGCGSSWWTIDLVTGDTAPLDGYEPQGAAPSQQALVVMDDDGLPEKVELDPAQRLLAIGRSGGTTSVQHRVDAGYRTLLGGDMDGDGCGDVVLLDVDGGRAQLVRSTACAGVPLHIGLSEVLSYRDRLRQGPREPGLPTVAPRFDQGAPSWTPSFLGVELPPMLGAAALTPPERQAYQRTLVVGTGWVYGSSWTPGVVTLPLFPAMSVGMEWGGPRLRAYTGVDSGGLFFWNAPEGGTGGLHLADLTLGIAAGSPRLRAGPFVTGGMYSYGAGLRAVMTPWRVSPTELAGIEARLTWFAPATGEVMLLYVWSEARAPAGPRSKRMGGAGTQPSGPGVCTRFGAGLGLAMSLSGTGSSWEFVGTGQALALSGSPMIQLSCESDSGPTGGLVSLQVAPALGYLTASGERYHHLGTATLGWMVGSRATRVGPILSAGFWEAQAGIRGVTDVWTDKQGLHHRVELRAAVLASRAGAGEASLSYVLSYDPRGRPSSSK